MALSRREKSAIVARLDELKALLSGNSLKRRERSALFDEWNEKLKLLSGKDTASSNTVIDDWLAGKFNGLPLDLMIAKMDEVEAAGGTLDQLKEGAQVWVVANAVQFGLAVAA